MVFSILRMVTMPRNFVEILIKNSAFCLKNKFFSKRLKIKQDTAKIEVEFYMYFDFRLG